MATENLNPNWKKVSNININIANVIILFVELISSDLIYTKNEFQGFLFGTLRSLNEEREGNNEFCIV